MRKPLLLTIACLFTSFAFAQKWELTRGEYNHHATLRSYASEDDALNDRHIPESQKADITDLEYLTLKDDSNITFSSVNSKGNWTAISHPREAVISSGDKAVVYRAIISVKRQADFHEFFLTVGAAAANSIIYISGHEVGSSYDSTSTIEYNITDFLQEGLNELIIVCTSHLSPIESISRLGISSDLGIYTKDKVHVEEITYRSSLFEDGTNALIQGEIAIKSHLLNKKKFRIGYKLYGADGHLVALGNFDTDIEMEATSVNPFALNIRDPKLWSAKRPNLYTLVVTITQERRVTDITRHTIAIRSESCEEGNILINGKTLTPVAIEISPDLSFDREEVMAEIRTIKSLGVNTLLCRTPMNEDYLAACDASGLYVVDMITIDNSRSGQSLAMDGSLSNDPLWLDNHLQRVSRHIRSFSMHPSPIAWQLVGGGANGYNIYESYLYAKKLDPTRPIINHAAQGEWNSDPLKGFWESSVGSWSAGDLLEPNGALSEKAYEVRATYIPVYVKEKEDTPGTFEIKNNTPDTLKGGDIRYRITVNGLTTLEGLVGQDIAPGETSGATITLTTNIPFAMQIKYSQKLRFGTAFQFDIFLNNEEEEILFSRPLEK